MIQTKQKQKQKHKLSQNCVFKNQRGTLTDKIRSTFGYEKNILGMCKL